MRKYTFVVSVVVHLAAVVAVLVAPLLATAPLPAVRDATTWVQAVVTTVPPPAARQRPRSQAAATRPAIPVVAPRGIDPEPETPPVVEAFGALDEIGNGTVPGGLLPGAIGAGTAHALPPPSLPPLVRARTPVRPGGALERPRRIVDVAPIYPKLALAVRREGVVILEALRHFSGNRTHAAKALGISIRTLRNKLAEYRVMGIKA